MSAQRTTTNSTCVHETRLGSASDRVPVAMAKMGIALTQGYLKKVDQAKVPAKPATNRDLECAPAAVQLRKFKRI